MIRCTMWGFLWLVTLGVLEIDVEYSDGLHIRLHSWVKNGRS